MISVLHVLDRHCTWESGVTLGQLGDRLDAHAVHGDVVYLRNLTEATPHPVPADAKMITAGIPFTPLASAVLHRYAKRRAVTLVHAWSVSAAAAARAAVDRSCPLLVSVHDPALSPREVATLRALSLEGPLGVVCAAERVQRRLVEQGVPLEECVIVRPAVDFSATKRAMGQEVRDRIGIAPGALLLLAAEPPSWDRGTATVIWSALMRWYLDEDVRVVVPGLSRDLPRLERLAAAAECPHVACFTRRSVDFVELCVAADALVLGDPGDCSVTAVAWAMAAGTPIIAPATYATTEVLAHDLNALLYKPHSIWRRSAVEVCRLYDRLGATGQVCEVARGQAYEVFSLQRMVRQMQQLYANMQEGASASRDIRDPAIVGA